MSKIKNKYFDEINTGMEKARLERYLTQYPVQSDFSPIMLAKEVYSQFNLSKQEIAEVMRNYYNF
jgi:hypothetical protein